MLRKSGVSRNVTEELCQDLSEVPWFVMDSFDPTDENVGILEVSVFVCD